MLLLLASAFEMVQTRHSAPRACRRAVTFHNKSYTFKTFSRVKHFNRPPKYPTARSALYAFLVRYICACAAASIETMESREALRETASPRRQRACDKTHTGKQERTVTDRTAFVSFDPHVARNCICEQTHTACVSTRPRSVCLRQSHWLGAHLVRSGPGRGCEQKHTQPM